MSMTQASAGTPVNTPRQVLFASLIGTTIEFFDFYIYATAAVLVFPSLFFPATDPASSTLASLATFGIAFLARPIGSALFGHFGDRIGRKKPLRAHDPHLRAASRTRTAPRHARGHGAHRHLWPCTRAALHCGHYRSRL